MIQDNEIGKEDYTGLLILTIDTPKFCGGVFIERCIECTKS